MHRAGRVAGALAEMLEHELDADPDVFLELGERESGLREIVLVVGAERCTADLREVARDLLDGLLRVRTPGVQLQAAETETGQKTLAPRRERADLRIERLLVAGQQRLESHLAVVQHAPRLVLDGVKRFTDRRLAVLLPLLQLLLEPTIRGRDSADAHDSAEPAVQLGERRHDACLGERLRQSLVCELLFHHDAYETFGVSCYHRRPRY